MLPMRQLTKTEKLLFAVTIIIASIGTVSAWAQTETETTEPIHYLIAFGSFVVSGVFYSSSGWIKKIRKKLAGENVPLDYNKMAKTVGIGTLLGIGAFVYSTYLGETIHIIDMQQFLVQVSINTTAILFIDKWILGRAESETQVISDSSDLHNAPIPTEE